MKRRPGAVVAIVVICFLIGIAIRGAGFGVTVIVVIVAGLITIVAQRRAIARRSARSADGD